ncbi:MAG: hypothetical protein WC479_03015 [Candidatus Izemoplasmatales bacterium]
MSTFPTDLPNVKTNFDGATSVASEFQNEQGEEINALAAKVGKDSSAVTTSHDYKLSGVTGSYKAVSTETTTGTNTGDQTNITGSAATLTTARLINGTSFNGSANIVNNFPQGFLINGKIVPSVASNDLTVAIKGLDGNDPSATNPVYCRIGDTVRSITAASSVTVNSSSSKWLNLGGAETTGKEVDLFVYLIYKAATGEVFPGFSRIPYAQIISDSANSGTGVNEKDILFNITPAATDSCELIGRFACTMTFATPNYRWSVPTFTTANLIQRPIYETRELDYTNTLTNDGGSWTNAPTINTNKYYVHMDRVGLRIKFTFNATSGGSGLVYAKIPFTAAYHTPISCFRSNNICAMASPYTNGSMTIALYDGNTAIANSNYVLINGEYKI